MAGKIIIDTGPLYTYFDNNDHYHYWVKKQFSKLNPPFLTCEAVLSETIFLLQRESIDADAVFKVAERGDLIIQPVEDRQKQVQAIIVTYQNIEASFADACLVAMAEQTPDSRIFTLDSDFTIYRDSDGEPLSLIVPE